jgi:hypothetical protein
MHRFPSAIACRTLVFLTATAAIAACDESTGPGGGPGPLPDVVTAEVIDTAGSIFRSLRVTLAEEAPIEVFYQPVAGGRVFRMIADSAAIEHSVLLPRLRAETDYAFAVRSYNEDGPADSIARGTFTTDSLPTIIASVDPTITGTASFPILMVPFRTGDFRGQIAIEADGSVVWYRPSAGTALVAKPIPGSHDMLFIEGGFPGEAGNAITRVDPWGRQVARLERGDASPFGQIHHDLTALDGERALFIAFDTQTVRDTLVNGEALWEWNMTTGAVTKRWSSWDFIDWDTERDPLVPATQWLHANSVAIGPRGNYVVSFRTISQVISIAADFQSLEWRVGGPGATVGVSAQDRFVGQHAASEVAPNRLLLFDNKGGGAADTTSRTLEFAIDGDTAYTVMAYEPAPPISGPLRGGTYRLASGNTLSIFAAAPFAVHETTAAGSVAWSLTTPGDLRFTNTFRAAPWPDIAGEIEVDAMP